MGARVVPVQAVGREDVGRERLDQRRHQRRRLADPVGHRRPGDVDALAGVDLGLAVQRKVIAVLRGEDVREEAGTGLAAQGRQAGRRRLHGPVAGPANGTRPPMPDHPERRRHVLEDVGDILAALQDRSAAAVRARRRGRMHDRLARQVRRQRLAGGTLAPAVARCWIGRAEPSGSLVRLALAERERELLDHPRELLRRGAEPGPLEDGELGL